MTTMDWPTSVNPAMHRQSIKTHGENAMTSCLALHSRPGWALGTITCKIGNVLIVAAQTVRPTADSSTAFVTSGFHHGATTVTDEVRMTVWTSKPMPARRIAAAHGSVYLAAFIVRHLLVPTMLARHFFLDFVDQL